MLEELVEGPRPVSLLARRLGLKASAASKHVATLEAGQLIYKSRRGREVLCHLNFDVWQEVTAYIAMHARFWSGRLDELEAHLLETETK